MKNDRTPTLTWTNPPAAVCNALFFSTDGAAVTAADGSARVLYDGVSFWANYQHPEALALGTDYYWRVLEYDSAGACTTGAVWHFTTVFPTIAAFPWTEGFELDSPTLPAWHQEYVADTDPTNPASYFRMTAISNGPPVTVYFTPSSLARHYTLQYADSLVGGIWSNAPGMGPRTGAGSVDAMTDAGAEGSRPRGSPTQRRIRASAPSRVFRGR